LDNQRAGQVLGGFDGKRVIVIGDVMLDEYIWGHVGRVSPEAPVMVIDANRYTHVPGGAANVVNNICALGGVSLVVGVIGDDQAGEQLRTALANEGAETAGLIVDPQRRTTRKTRVIAHSHHQSQQIVRIDHEDRDTVRAAVAEAMLAGLEAMLPSADAVVFSDYQKGVISPEFLKACVALIRASGKPVTGNLKPRALTEHASLTILTMNLPEAAAATGRTSLDTAASVHQAGRELLARTGADNVLITQSADGLTLLEASSPGRPIHIASHPVEVYDAAGAGDTVISTTTLALAAGATAFEAVSLANHAGAQAVKKVGVSTVTRDQILESVETAAERSTAATRRAR